MRQRTFPEGAVRHAIEKKFLRLGHNGVDKSCRQESAGLWENTEMSRRRPSPISSMPMSRKPARTGRCGMTCGSSPRRRTPSRNRTFFSRKVKKGMLNPLRLDATTKHQVGPSAAHERQRSKIQRCRNCQSDLGRNDIGIQMVRCGQFFQHLALVAITGEVHLVGALSQFDKPAASSL